MILFLISIIDILAGVCLMFPNFLGFYIGIAVLLKGLSSMLAIPTGEMGIIIMGVIDIAIGAILLLNFSVPWIWIIPMLKGVYSLLSSL